MNEEYELVYGKNREIIHAKSIDDAARISKDIIRAFSEPGTVTSYTVNNFFNRKYGEIRT